MQYNIRKIAVLLAGICVLFAGCKANKTEHSDPAELVETIIQSTESVETEPEKDTEPVFDTIILFEELPSEPEIVEKAEKTDEKNTTNDLADKPLESEPVTESTEGVPEETGAAIESPSSSSLENMGDLIP